MLEPIRVLIVDDQRLLCEGFRKLIEMEPNLAVVGIAGDGEEALAVTERLTAAQTPPDVLQSEGERWPLLTYDSLALQTGGLMAFGYTTAMLLMSYRSGD